jgi:hypothetical protein
LNFSKICFPFDALPVSGQNQSKINKAIGYINNVKDRDMTNLVYIEKNIDDTLKAIDSILSVTSADVTEIRLAIDDLLKVCEARWYRSNF